MRKYDINELCIIYIYIARYLYRDIYIYIYTYVICHVISKVICLHFGKSHPLCKTNIVHRA